MAWGSHAQPARRRGLMLRRTTPGPAGQQEESVNACGYQRTTSIPGLDSLAFLASAVLSFVSIRSRTQWARLEALAELIFLAGFVLLGVVTLGDRVRLRLTEPPEQIGVLARDGLD